MKKVNRIFIVVFLVSLGSGLWAQTTVYDTVVPVTRFSYSVGFRFTWEYYKDFAFDVPAKYYPYWSGGSEWRDRRVKGEFQSWCPGLFFQAEWRHFILGISPRVIFPEIDGDVDSNDWDSYGEYEKGLHERIRDEAGDTVFGVDLQFLFRLPLAVDKFQFSLFAGPEVTITKGFGINLMGGLDIGFKITTHHALFLGMAAGTPFLNANHLTWFQPVLLHNKLSKLDYNEDSYKEGGGFRVQVSLGLRILVIKNTYYYQGNEAGKGH